MSKKNAKPELRLFPKDGEPTIGDRMSKREKRAVIEGLVALAHVLEEGAQGIAATEIEVENVIKMFRDTGPKAE